MLGFFTVALGALGAHKLKQVLTAANLEIFEKGIRYQFYHVIAILSCALLLEKFRQKNFYYAGMLFIAGIICFSGSLYILALHPLHISSGNSLSHYFPTNVIGPVTPIGGLLLLSGWLLMFLGAIRVKS